MSAAEATKKNENDGRRRFTGDQIRFLEHMFENQSQPELRTKQQVADRLGLHPRQVAIWFQNKRARSKSRRVETDYNGLKHEYDELTSKSESLRNENRSLLNQLQILRDLLGRREQTTRRPELAESCSEESRDQTTKKYTEVLSENYAEETGFPCFDGAEFFGEERRSVDVKHELHEDDDWDDENGCSLESELPNWWEFERDFE